MPEYATQETVALVSVCWSSASTSHSGPERLVLRVLVGVLFTVVHLLLEGLCFFLVSERETR